MKDNCTDRNSVSNVLLLKTVVAGQLLSFSFCQVRGCLLLVTSSYLFFLKTIPDSS